MAEPLKKPRIVHFSPTAGSLGGIWTYVRIVLASGLQEKYLLEASGVERGTKAVKPKVIAELYRNFKQNPMDLLQIHDATMTSWHAMVAARMAKVPRILVSNHAFCEDLFYLTRWKKIVWREMVEPYVFKHADAVYNVSSFGATKPVIRNNAKIDFGVIDNAVAIRPVAAPDLELKRSFGFADDDLVALCASRADAEKGWYVLADALLALDADGRPAPKVILAGDGPDLAAVREKLKPLSDKGKVVVAGRRDDMPQLNAISDLCVLPTFRDYQSYTLLEAMQQGKAVLTTRVGGNSELVIDGVTGQLISVGSPTQLADALTWFATHPEERNRMGAAGKLRQEEKFSMPRFEADLDRIYQQLLAMPPRDRR